MSLFTTELSDNFKKEAKKLTKNILLLPSKLQIY